MPRAAFRDHLNEQPPIDLLFVDDGSTDGTRRVLEELVTSAPARLSVLGLAANQGKGEAIRQGVLSAFDRGYEFIGYWDADLATPLEAVQAFIPVLDRQPTLQCVFGARVKLMGRSITRRSIRHYAGRLFAAATSLTLGLGIYDT